MTISPPPLLTRRVAGETAAHTYRRSLTRAKLQPLVILTELGKVRSLGEANTHPLSEI